MVEDASIPIYDAAPGRRYRVVGDIRVRVTASTVFSKAPAVEDANAKLRERAARLHADGIVDVTYRRGISATSWKALTAKGTAVVFEGAG